MRRRESAQETLLVKPLTEIITDQLDSQNCPDCFDVMNMVYDWDKISYLCDNCGLTVANSDILSIHDNEEEEGCENER